MRYCQLMFSAPLLAQIFDHMGHTCIMNWLRPTEKFTAATYTKYVNFWRVEETHMNRR